MYLMNSEVQTGKTYQSIKRTLENDYACMIVFSFAEKKKILNMEPLLESKIYTVDEYLNGKTKGKGFDEVIIDNVELVLNRIFIEGVFLITGTLVDYDWRKNANNLK